MPSSSELLSSAKETVLPRPKVVILTGAGLSAESGIDTFRGKGGIWKQYSPEDVATQEAFKQNPDKVHEFYNARRKQLKDKAIKPNKAHQALADLGKKLKGDLMLITQNVDNLLERAGATGITHMHGELSKIRCEACADVREWTADLSTDTQCLNCGKAGKLRPHIVWFGEIPFGLEAIYTALANCHLFISVGTSGSVYPASGFVQEARKGSCRKTVEINPERTEITGFFSEHISGNATEALPRYLKQAEKEILAL